MHKKKDLAQKIGVQIKDLRQEAGLTLKKLADTTGVSSALLSRIEHGKIMPSIPTLQTIADSLMVGIGHFFRNEDRRLYVVSPREKHRSVNAGKGYGSIELLVEGMENAFMDAAIVTAKDKSKENEVEPAIHNGQEFMYVLDGKIEITLGSEKYILKEGDAAYWYGSIPHKGVSVSRKPARTLNVHLIPGKRVGTFEKSE